jgi:hypothetical protein
MALGIKEFLDLAVLKYITLNLSPLGTQNVNNYEKDEFDFSRFI